MSLFKKESKVKAGKPVAGSEKKSLFVSLSDSWKKMDSMDPKKAYTYGAVVIAGLVLLLMCASVASSSKDKEDFSEYETRGYDLSRMPFSSDEAEAYLLATKYPDMQEPIEDGLYSPEEKAERQAEDEEELLEQIKQADEAEEEIPVSYSRRGGRSYGEIYSSGGGSGARGSTKINQMSSASLKGASGTGINSTFGATGDFSNFKSQDKGKEINSANLPKNAGRGNARTALQQMAQASRAAAGLKDDKMLNAKKALMGGSVKGSDAFMSDSGAVDLSNAKGLNLDPDAPLTPDLSDLDNKLNSAKENAEDKDKKGTELTFLQQILLALVENISEGIGDGISGMMKSWVDPQARADRDEYKEKKKEKKAKEKEEKKKAKEDKKKNTTT